MRNIFSFLFLLYLAATLSYSKKTTKKSTTLSYVPYKGKIFFKSFFFFDLKNNYFNIYC